MKAIVALVAVVAFALVGCSGKSPDNPAAQGAMPASGIQAGAPQSGAVSKNNPHAGIAPDLRRPCPARPIKARSFRR